MVAAALGQIMDRLDRMEQRLEGKPDPIAQDLDEWGDWNEDPSVTEPLAEVIHPVERQSPIPRFPTPPQKTPAFTPRTEGVEWEPGKAMLPVSDTPVGEGRGTGMGHYPNQPQLAQMWQREVVAPMRRRPVEDNAG